MAYFFPEDEGTKQSIFKNSNAYDAIQNLSIPRQLGIVHMHARALGVWNNLLFQNQRRTWLD